MYNKSKLLRTFIQRFVKSAPELSSRICGTIISAMSLLLLLCLKNPIQTFSNRHMNTNILNSTFKWPNIVLIKKLIDLELANLTC